MAIRNLAEQAEQERQDRTGDQFFYRADLSYMFELRVADQSGFYPLVLKPEALSIQTQFTVAPTATLDGGLFVEENGAVMRTLQIRGTTGWQPTPRVGTVLKPDLQPQLTSYYKRRATSFVDRAVEKLSGQAHFQALNDLVFERYSDYKRDPAVAESTRLIFHMPKESESWVVAPTNFSLQRSAAQPLSYNYAIDLLLVEPWGVRAARRATEFSRLAPLTIVSRPPPSLLQRITNGINYLRRVVASVRAVASRIQAVIQTVANVINDVANFIRETVNTAISIVRGIANAIGNVQRAIIELVSLPGRIYDNLRAALLGIEDDLLVFFRFVTRATRTNSRVAGRQTTPSNATLTAAGQRPLTAASTGTVTNQAPEAQRQLPAVTATRQHAVSITDTLETIARRYTGDSRNWSVIAQLNGLRAPYISTSGLPYTAQPGARILVPDARATSPAIATILDSDVSGDVRGVDFRLQQDRASGLYDIVLGSTDIALVGGNDNLVQALRVRLDTERGSSLLAPEYGFRIAAGSNIDFVQARIGELSLREALQGDPRVLTVDSITVQDSPADSFVATATVSVYAQTEALSVTAATRYPNA
jgi:hypothetical protein